MMRPLRSVLGWALRVSGLLGLLLGGRSPAWADEVVRISGHPSYPPITWEENGTIVGVGAELARTIFTELKLPFEIKADGRWIRVQKDAEAGDLDVIMTIYQNQERKRYLDYTIPILKDPNVVFVWKGKAFPFRSWKDLIGRQGVANTGESFEEKFDLFIKEQLTVEWVPNAVQNFRKLESGRADYYISGLYAGLTLAAVEGFEDRVEVLPKPIVTADFHMAFSKKSKYTYLLPRVNKIIARLKADGTIDRWVKEFLERHKKAHRKS